MLNFCVFGCWTTSQTPNAKLFTFPTIDKRSAKCIAFSKNRLSNWMAVLKKSTVNECKNLKICHLHFISGRIYYQQKRKRIYSFRLIGTKARLMDINNPDWVPSLNLHDDGSDSSLQGTAEFTGRTKIITDIT